MAERSDDTTTLAELKATMAAFVAERNWTRFHQPRNLAASISIEAAELLEHFQWEDPPLSPERRSAVVEELCDVLAYSLSLANALELDVSSAFRAKLAKNARKYPASEVRSGGSWAESGGGRSAGEA